jgi:hypothetical protein
MWHLSQLDQMILTLIATSQRHAAYHVSGALASWQIGSREEGLAADEAISHTLTSVDSTSEPMPAEYRN